MPLISKDELRRRRVLQKSYGMNRCLSLVHLTTPVLYRTRPLVSCRYIVGGPAGSETELAFLANQWTSIVRWP